MAITNMLKLFHSQTTLTNENTTSICTGSHVKTNPETLTKSQIIAKMLRTKELKNIRPWRVPSSKNDNEHCFRVRSFDILPCS